MSEKPPPIILRTFSNTSSTSANKPINQMQPLIGNAHMTIRPSIAMHQSSMQCASPQAVPLRSFIVKSHRESIQQVLDTTASPKNIDMKPIVIQSHETLESQHPNKRIALEATHLHHPSVTFSAITKSEVINDLQTHQPSSSSPVATLIGQASSSMPSFPTMRVVRPSTIIQTTDIPSATTPSSSQQVLLQQHANLMISQPIITLQVQSDSTIIQKENQIQNTNIHLDSTTAETKPPTNDHLPIQYQRKPCNCTKSMCLKLYCDCFANGLYCQNCSCLNCHNDARHDDDRQRAINATLERNPNAFKSKMYRFANTTLPHTDRPLKGCNCKKSSCHKRYCECYESRVPCTNLCKCVGCKNTEQSIHPLNVGFYRSGEPKTTTQTALDQIPRTGPPIESTPANNVFNMEVTEALASCLLVMGQQCETNQMNQHDSQEAILKEFQRCMHHIVQSQLGRPTP